MRDMLSIQFPWIMRTFSTAENSEIKKYHANEGVPIDVRLLFAAWYPEVVVIATGISRP
jgi:hypothetical protein